MIDFCRQCAGAQFPCSCCEIHMYGWDEYSPFLFVEQVKERGVIHGKIIQHDKQKQGAGEKRNTFGVSFLTSALLLPVATDDLAMNTPPHLHAVKV